MFFNFVEKCSSLHCHRLLIRVKSGNFGHQVNSDIHLQTVEIQMRQPSRQDFYCLLLGLHYVPGSHGSHGSQKRISSWCFESFLSLCSSSGKSRYVFSRPVKKECNNWDISHFL